ncbi:hypothetical protein M8C13_18770 [Crossiella sp. SN42]|uniref:hypothetical protein n=1 Tax=Crossiella sp. SN42 TaxID=2944808 RepID=UPI00207CD13A|nr:hypothetical protein [Crossiella sp. SN42]MCO1577802.1 hypothetical protein [Crossiella sp. SN42]
MIALLSLGEICQGTGGFAMGPRDAKATIDFGGGAKFTVDVAQLDNLIKGLTEARDKVDAIDLMARETNRMANAPSEEQYSQNAIKQIIERTISDRDGTHTKANRAYHAALDTMIQKLKAARDQYAGTEGVNQNKLKPGG